jgi:hypothetical protein
MYAKFMYTQGWHTEEREFPYDTEIMSVSHC